MKVFFSGLLPLAEPLFVVQLVVQLFGYHCFGAKLENCQFWAILGNLGQLENWKFWAIWGNLGKVWTILEDFWVISGQFQGNFSQFCDILMPTYRRYLWLGYIWISIYR